MKIQTFKEYDNLKENNVVDFLGLSGTVDVT